MIVRRISVVVGKPSTPTPSGHFFIVEHVPQPSGSVLGPVALATSDYSDVLQELDGGPGQMALHGRDGVLLRALLGSAASHGCIRMADRQVGWLASRVPDGTPISIGPDRTRLCGDAENPPSSSDGEKSADECRSKRRSVLYHRSHVCR